MSKEASNSRAYWLAIVVLTLIGLGLAGYLTYVHVNVYTNPAFQSSCNINKSFNCETVALSSYAVMAGLPTSVWGLIGYVFLLIVSLLGWRRSGKGASPLHGMLTLLTACCMVAGVFFAYISFKHINSLCIYCMGTYFINIVVFVLMFLALGQDKVSLGDGLGAFMTWLPRNLVYLIVIGILLFVGIRAYPQYWQATWKGASLPLNICGGMRQDAEMGHGEDENGHWIGAKKPHITIIEFADYECPYCQRAHFDLRMLLRKCPEGIRLYHRHYPLDHQCNPRINRPFHKQACLLARAAHCSGLQGKFWKANDFLYTKGKKLPGKDLVANMVKLGLDGKKLNACINAKPARNAIDKDMAAGRSYKMQGTPFFVMNGVPFHKGYIPKEDIIKALNAPRSVAKKAPARRPAVQRAATPRRRAPAPRRPVVQRAAVPAPQRRPKAAPATPAPKAPTFRPLAQPRPTAPRKR